MSLRPVSLEKSFTHGIIGAAVGITIMATAAIVKNCQRQPIDYNKYEEYREAEANYNRALIQFQNFREDAPKFEEHLAELYDMKYNFKDTYREYYPDIDSYTDEELSEKLPGYGSIIKAINRTNHDIDIATGKALEKAKSRKTHVVDSLNQVHNRK